MKGGKRSGAYFPPSPTRSGAGKFPTLGRTLRPPDVLATWNLIFARWNGALTYWR